MPAKKNTKKDKDDTKYDLSDAQIVYSNLISLVKVTNEDAELFLGIKDMDNDKNVKVTHRLIITLPHLFRLQEMLERTTKQISDKIEKINK